MGVGFHGNCRKREWDTLLLLLWPSVNFHGNGFQSRWAHFQARRSLRVEQWLGVLLLLLLLLLLLGQMQW